MQIYLVGGAVRDQLLNYPVYDKDWVVVGATADAMLAQGFQPVGKDFPVFIHPETGEEYALARTERKSGKGYTGFQYFASPEVTLEEDLRRRDLTINAIAQHPDGDLVGISVDRPSNPCDWRPARSGRSTVVWCLHRAVVHRRLSAKMRQIV